ADDVFDITNDSCLLSDDDYDATDGSSEPSDCSLLSGDVIFDAGELCTSDVLPRGYSPPPNVYMGTTSTDHCTAISTRHHPLTADSRTAMVTSGISQSF